MTPTSTERIAALESSLQAIASIATSPTTLASRVTCVVSAARRLDEDHVTHTVLLEAEPQSRDAAVSRPIEASAQPRPVAELTHAELSTERDKLLHGIDQHVLALRCTLSRDVHDAVSRRLEADAARLRELYAEAWRRGARL
jgi:hypothetical protein